MDYHQESVFPFPGGNDVKVLAGNSGSNVPWIFVTEDDCRIWNQDASMKFSVGLSQPASGEEPPQKKSRSSLMEEAAAVSRSKAIGKMFYKTRLCSRMRFGTCPYVTDCHFAHSYEELRKPPPNWKEIVAAAHEEDEAVSVEPGEGFKMLKRHGHHCKQFYTEEGCPYGDRCTFVHDEQARARGSEAITIERMESDTPFNWKTRICNRWEMKGYCPFEDKCHFAHGVEGLLIA